MLKRQLGAVLSGLAVAAAVPITVIQATQPAHSSFRSAESEALVAPSQRPQETRASRSDQRQPLDAAFLDKVGKSLRAAERLHQQELAAARAKATAPRAAEIRAARAKAREAARQRASYAASYSGSSVKAYAAREVAARGWSSQQFNCLNTLWDRESGWSYRAYNSGSGAYGIPQALPGSKMASAGSDWQTNPFTQIRWGLGYISSDYGTPCGALAHSDSTGWY